MEEALDQNGTPTFNREDRFYRALLAVFACTSLTTMLWRFVLPGNLYLASFTDDYYYYVLIAKHVALNGMSSFNGLQLTNGYHPLWLLLNSALMKLTGDGKTFFVTSIFGVWVLVVATLWQLLRLRPVDDRRRPLQLACTIFSATYMVMLSRTGMEVSLAIFFLCVFWVRMREAPLELQSGGGAFLSGLIAAGAILSRIDCSLVIALYGALTCLHLAHGKHWASKGLFWFVLGLAPVAIYVGINSVHFHTLLPISGMAKSLEESPLPSTTPLNRLFRLDAINLLFTWPSMAAITAWMVRGFRSGQFLAYVEPQGRVDSCVVLHPVLLFSVLCLTSDWQTWTWYLYAFVPIVAFVTPGQLQTLSTHALKWTVTAAIGLCLITLIAGVRINADGRAIYEAAVTLSKFSQQHPGTYAIGDRAGEAAYLMPVPVIQLEGLVGDRAFLSRIEAKQSLAGVLQQMNVDYYVTAATAADGGCVKVREPAQGGTASPAMRARICVPPLLSFVYNGVRTSVYDARNIN